MISPPGALGQVMLITGSFIHLLLFDPFSPRSLQPQCALFLLRSMLSLLSPPLTATSSTLSFLAPLLASLPVSSPCSSPQGSTGCGSGAGLRSLCRLLLAPAVTALLVARPRGSCRSDSPPVTQQSARSPASTLLGVRQGATASEIRFASLPLRAAREA